MDACFFLVRFTPRRRRSLWSQVNRTMVLELIAVGRIRPRGLGEVEAARADGRWDRAYPSARTATVPHDLQIALDGCPVAAVRFDALGRAARYAMLLGLANARRPETRRRGIASFLDAAQA